MLWPPPTGHKSKSLPWRVHYLEGEVCHLSSCTCGFKSVPKVIWVDSFSLLFQFFFYYLVLFVRRWELHEWVSDQSSSALALSLPPYRWSIGMRLYLGGMHYLVSFYIKTKHLIKSRQFIALEMDCNLVKAKFTKPMMPFWSDFWIYLSI